MGTQTDTHFMESNVVKSYEWNEWELRRKAIKLVCVGVCGWVGEVSRYVTTFGAQSPHLLIFNGPFHLQANLRQKVTHSMQTDLSHYKRDNATQVYLPRYTRMNVTRQPFRVIFTTFFITFFLVVVGNLQIFHYFLFLFTVRGRLRQRETRVQVSQSPPLTSLDSGAMETSLLKQWTSPFILTHTTTSQLNIDSHDPHSYISAHTHTILNTTVGSLHTQSSLFVIGV